MSQAYPASEFHATVNIHNSTGAGAKERVDADTPRIRPTSDYRATAIRPPLGDGAGPHRSCETHKSPAHSAAPRASRGAAQSFGFQCPAVITGTFLRFTKRIGSSPRFCRAKKTHGSRDAPRGSQDRAATVSGDAGGGCGREGGAGLYCLFLATRERRAGRPARTGAICSLLSSPYHAPRWEPPLSTRGYRASGSRPASEVGTTANRRGHGVLRVSPPLPTPPRWRLVAGPRRLGPAGRRLERAGLKAAVPRDRDGENGARRRGVRLRWC